MAKTFPHATVAQQTFQVTFGFDDIAIDKKEIAYALGYGNRMIPFYFHEAIDSIIQRVPELCKIHTGYRLMKSDKSAGTPTSLHLEGSQFSTQQLVTSQLKNADQAILFLCSIGPGMEGWSKQLAGEGDPLMSFLVDTVASVLVEAVADVLHDSLTEHFKAQGLKITNRYSPGYCDWSVAEQHKVFAFFPHNFCGVVLTDSALMLPIKSISGIMGVGRNVEFNQYFCDTCGRKDCTYKVFREKALSSTSKDES